MGQSRRVTIIEICVVIVLIAILAILFLATRERAREPHTWGQCIINLKYIGTAFAQYLNAYGGDSVFPVPAASFRGDTWLCALYWKGLLSDKRAFVCPSTADSAEQVPEPEPYRNGRGYPISSSQFAEADTVGSHQVSYCGRTNMSGIKNVARTETNWFNEKAFKGSPVACDKPGNHDDVVHVVFSDCHVERLRRAERFVGDKTQTGGTDVMRTLQYMDNGDP